MRSAINVIGFLTVGLVLSFSDLGVTTWQYWVVLAAVFVISLT